MGLFDWVTLETPLTNAEAATVTRWQTKDFDPYMENYKITADGKLMHEVVHYEDKSDKSAAPGSFESVRGCMTPVHDGWKDLEFHGILNFYGRASNGNLVECFAKFTDGKLVKIDVETAAAQHEAEGEGHANREG